MNYRTLLKKYINLVSSEEGIHYINRATTEPGDNVQFEQEKIDALNECWDEIDAEWRANHPESE